MTKKSTEVSSALSLLSMQTPSSLSPALPELSIFSHYQGSTTAMPLATKKLPSHGASLCRTMRACSIGRP